MNTPNPGSQDALDQGCICPVMDNHYGEGIDYGNGKKEFWITGGCPLHDNLTSNGTK